MDRNPYQPPSEDKRAAQRPTGAIRGFLVASAGALIAMALPTAARWIMLHAPPKRLSSWTALTSIGTLVLTAVILRGFGRWVEHDRRSGGDGGGSTLGIALVIVGALAALVYAFGTHFAEAPY